MNTFIYFGLCWFVSASTAIGANFLTRSPSGPEADVEKALVECQAGLVPEDRVIFTRALDFDHEYIARTHGADAPAVHSMVLQSIKGKLVQQVLIAAYEAHCKYEMGLVTDAFKRLVLLREQSKGANLPKDDPRVRE